MTSTVHLVTRIATWVGDLLAAPFGNHAGWLLVVAAVVFAIAALLLFKWATPQQRLAAARGRLIGRLYEAALYQTSLAVIMRVQGGVLVANLRYLACALPAVAALVVPLLLVIPQLEARLGRRPLAVGETALVTVALAADREAILTADSGLVIEAGPVRDQAHDEVVWRVRAVTAGEHVLQLTGAGDPVTLAVPVATAGLPAISAGRHRSAFTQLVLDPADAPLARETGLDRIDVALPARKLGLPWLVSFSVLSLATGLLLRSRLGVEL